MLSVTNLSKSFLIHHLGGKRICGFRPVTFQVNEGASLALSGPSGTGKSSILKCIHRTYLPTTGDITYRCSSGATVNLSRLPAPEIIRLRRNEIGYVTQFLRVLPRVPALQIVAEPLLRAGHNVNDAQRKAATLLERLRIPRDLFDAFPATFSGGEQQRINIARAVIACPRLLLLDEPTASLDRPSVEVVVELLKELRTQGTTMVMIFHDPAVMHALADHIHRTTSDQEDYDIPQKTATLCDFPC